MSDRRNLACTGLTFVCVMQAVAGVAVAFAYNTALFAWHRTRLADCLLETPDVPVTALPLLHQFTAMLGGTMAAWALGMAFLAHIALRRGESWAGVAIASSTALWFVIDTSLSFSHGAWINVGFNVAAVVMIAVPLALAWPRSEAQRKSPAK